MFGKIKRAFMVHAISVYLLWAVLPLVFWCLWGVGFGYDYTGPFYFIHVSVQVPSLVWWLLSPLTFFVSGLVTACLELGGIGFFIFVGVAPCVKGYWVTFPLLYSLTGWLLAYAISLFVSLKIAACTRDFSVLGKKRPGRFCLRALCCAASLCALFVCKGEGPYGPNIQNELNAMEALQCGEITPGEEKFGYRFVSDRLAVPLNYRRGNRARTFYKVTWQADPKQDSPGVRSRADDTIFIKDTAGKNEAMAVPDVVPYDVRGRVWNYSRKFGWEPDFCEKYSSARDKYK